MWSFTLRGFAATDVDRVRDLTLLREYRFAGAELSAAKQWLTERIGAGVLPVERFYRLEGSRGDARLTVAFYLFDDRRICPVRIWNKTELFGMASLEPAWMVDFNGLPPWSAMSAAEPRWKVIGFLPEKNCTVGRSARDWRKRNCWTVDPAGTPLHAAS